MRQLYVLRHAKAQASSASGDIGRELTAAGMLQAASVAKHFAGVFADAEVPLDAVLASSATRTRQTAEALANVVERPVKYSQELYLASESDLRLMLQSLDDNLQTVLLIGHNAGISDLVSYLSGTPCGLRTASVAHLDCPMESWSVSISKNQWRLQGTWHPAQ